MNKTLSESNCDCHMCKLMCKNSPCFPTPAEAQRLIDKGYGPRLALSVFADVQTGDFHPAIVGQFDERDGCTFHTESGHCELHDLGLKPLEGRLAHHNIPYGRRIRLDVCKTWQSNEGISVIERFPDDDHKYKVFLILQLRRQMASQPQHA